MSNTNTSRLEGIPVSNIMAHSTPKAGGKTTDIAERILKLSVPTGFAYIPDETRHKLEYQSSSASFSYETIPEQLYDKLIDLVSEKLPTK